MLGWFSFVSLWMKAVAPGRRDFARRRAASTRAVSTIAIVLSISAISHGQTLSPSQLLSAYGFNTVQQTYTGAGQTIAIYSESYYSGLQADVNQFSSTYMNGVSTTLEVTEGTGGTPPGTDTPKYELALDVEYAHLIAPAATIMVIAGPDSETAANYAATHGASVFSTSYSGYETSTGSVQIQTDDASFATASSKMAIFAAAGDSSHVDYPASSPDVVGVAGSVLTVTGSGAYSSETGWSSSGGGPSAYESEPGYQYAVQKTGIRQTPDVSLAGGNDFPVILSGAQAYKSGSSFASPMFASYIALVDEARAEKGYAALSSGTLLNSLYESEQNGAYSEIFNDITTGTDANGLAAGVGYDEVTGLGSPQAVDMLDYLDTSAAPEPAGFMLLMLPVTAIILCRRRVPVTMAQ